MQIPTLSNRSVGFVLLGLIAVLSYWGIRYVFLLNIGSLRFEVLDGSSYFVILKKANIEVSSLNCQQACTFADIPAGRYQYTASSSGRLVKTEQVDILREKINTILLQSNLDVKS